MERILVTGATGFIGSALARFYTEAGKDVHAIVRSPASTLPRGVTAYCYDGSVDSLSVAIQAAKPDVVFHMASLFLSSHAPKQVNELVASNVLFGTQLLEAMQLGGCKYLVSAGTSWQHYETLAYRPVNLYAATKQAFECIVQYYCDACEISCVTLKLFDTYGPGDTRKKLMNVLFDAAQRGMEIDMSPGHQIIDLTYIDDVVDAFCHAGDMIFSGQSKGMASYFISGDRLSVRKLVVEIQRILNTKILVNFGGRDYRLREVMAPVSADGLLLPGWKRHYSLAEGIRAVIGINSGASGHDRFIG
ncbi:MAG: NAD-dependent epimerase/dehydratase family protein [Pseudomonadota bacterium]